MKKNYLFTIIVATILALIVFIIFFDRQKDDALVFGSLLPLTGQVSSYGEMMQKGQLLAVEDIKKEFNDSIQIIFFNTEHKKDVALSRLAEAKNKNIKFFIEIFGSDQVEHCLEYAVSNNLFILSGVNTKPELIEMGRHHFARIMPNDAEATKEIFLWMQDYGLKDIAILYVNDDWGTGLLNSALLNLESFSLNLVGTFDINRNQQSFVSTVSKIKAKKPDALCLFIYPDDGGRFIKESFRQDFKPDFYATENFTGSDMIKTAQTMAEGVKLIVPSTSESNPKQSQMVERYKNKYKEEPSIFAIKGYDAVFVMYDIWKKSNDKSISDVKNIIRNNYSFSGVSGNIIFDDNGEFIPTKYERLIYKNIENNIQLIPIDK